MIQREQIKALALVNGFKLKQQLDGSEDLNPYVYEFAAALMAPLQAEVQRLTDTNKQFGKIIHDQVVANQAAWIEWQHGKGAEAAMVWVQNGLLGPGHIPDESEPWANDPQAYYDANKADPFPACHCGRPSNQLWMGHGACCHEHMKEIQQKEQAND